MPEATNQITDQENNIAVPRSIDLSFNEIMDCDCLQKLLKDSEINAPENTYIQVINILSYIKKVFSLNLLIGIKSK